MRRPSRALSIAASITAFVALTFVQVDQRDTVCDASTVVEMRVEDLVARCDLALEAHVTSLSASRDATGRIATDYALTVDRTFLGANSAQRTVRIPGGVLPDGRGLVLPGMPKLAIGENALVFLSRENQHGERLPIGLAQGRLRVAVDALGVKRLVRDVTDLEFVDAQGNVLPARAPITSLPYAATVARIESECARRLENERKGGGK